MNKHEIDIITLMYRLVLNTKFIRIAKKPPPN